MPSDEVVENAWTRARCTCECDHATHAHAARCGTALVWEQRGTAMPEGWKAVQTCHILCWSCYQKVTTAAAKRHGTAQTGVADAHHPDRR